MKEKIDLVYLWCNLDDPNFKQKKESFLKGQIVDKEANNPCRFTDNGELKYSLRSVELYAPWVNKIYIVTDNQIPNWLNLDNPKIEIINQNDILPQSAIPCFNSISIEHCIKNIPNLEEHFIYANDDMFFNLPTEPEFFFNKKGYPISRFRKKRKKRLYTLYEYALNNAENLIYKKFNLMLNFEPHHNIDAYLKSEVINCYETFKNEIDKTINSHFRNKENVERAIYQKYFVAVKKGEFKRVSRVDCKLNPIKRLINLIKKEYKKDSCLISPQGRNIEEILNKFRPYLFCINDSEETTNEDRKYLKEFLQKRYPNKSAFEI